MAQPSTLSELRAGIMDGIPIMVAVFPTGALFGTLAVGAGLSATEAVVMSTVVFAGASQMVAIELWGTNIPAWSIILSVFAVNFRHLLYSAAMAHIVAPFGWLSRAAMFFFLVDPAYALSAKRDAEGIRVTRPWYFGFSLLAATMWIASTVVGAVFGTLIENPRAFALDMVLPIYFLSMLLAFRGRPRWGRIVVVSGIVSVLVHQAPAFGIPLGPPWHISLGALAGILVAALGPLPPRPLKGGAPEPEPAT